MKRRITYCIFIIAILLCAGCTVSKHHVGVSDETGSTAEIKTGEPISVQVFTLEDVEVVPEIAQYDYEDACGRGEIHQLYGLLPGASEGTWYTITIAGVEYYYAGYDGFPDKVELMGYAIVSDEYSLENGISVGMTKSEVLKRCPAMAILDTEGNTLNEVAGHMGWNPSAYPRSSLGMDEKWEYVGKQDYDWANQFDYIMVAEVEQAQDSLPLYVALMMEGDAVSAITFYYPTAN